MKKFFIFVVLACLTMLVFVSCDSNPPSTDNSSQSSNQSDSVDSGERTVKMTSYDEEDNMISLVIYEYNPDDSCKRYSSLFYNNGILSQKYIFDYEYNSEGEITRTVYTLYDYDSDGTTALYHRRTETDSEYLDGNVKKETQSTYNDNNELTSKSVSEYEYENDTDGKVIKKTKSQSSYNSNNELTSAYIQEYEYEYNSDGETTKETEYEYESDGITLRYKEVTDRSYNQAGNILTISSSTFHGSSTVVTHEFLGVYEYDESGSIQKRTSQTNTSYFYSSDFNSLLQTRTQTTIITYDGKEILIFSSIDGSEPIYTGKTVVDIES